MCNARQKYSVRSEVAVLQLLTVKVSRLIVEGFARHRGSGTLRLTLTAVFHVSWLGKRELVTPWHMAGDTMVLRKLGLRVCDEATPIHVHFTPPCRLPCASHYSLMLR